MATKTNLEWTLKDSNRVYWWIEAERSGIVEKDAYSNSHHFWDYKITNENGANFTGTILGQYDEPININQILTDFSESFTRLLLADKVS